MLCFCLFACSFSKEIFLSAISSFLNSIRQISLYEHRGDYIFSLYRVSNNKETKRACEIFSQLLKIFWKCRKLMYWAPFFPTSATPLTMTLKQFTPQQRPRYRNRKNKEFFTTEMSTTLFMTVLTNTIFNWHWVLALFSNDIWKTNTMQSNCSTKHNRSKQRDEWIRILSDDLKLAQRAGKITRIGCDWFWFWFSLAEKLTRYFKVNHCV